MVITSSQLMRRKDRAKVLVEGAESWDLIVLDEAHHARRRAAGSAKEGGANALLKLMRGLKSRTKGLVLLTATPMQMHPIEIWDLMDLMGLPPGVECGRIPRLLRAGQPTQPVWSGAGSHGTDVSSGRALIWRNRPHGSPEPD